MDFSVINHQLGGGNSNILKMFAPGEIIQFYAYSSIGLVQPPTSQLNHHLLRNTVDGSKEIRLTAWDGAKTLKIMG